MIHNIQHLPVNPTTCKTCPFAQTHAEALQSVIIERMLGGNGSQICHGTEPKRWSWLNLLQRG